MLISTEPVPELYASYFFGQSRLFGILRLGIVFCPQGPGIVGTSLVIRSSKDNSAELGCLPDSRTH